MSDLFKIAAVGGLAYVFLSGKKKKSSSSLPSNYDRTTVNESIQSIVSDLSEVQNVANAVLIGSKFSASGNRRVESMMIEAARRNPGVFYAFVDGRGDPTMLEGVAAILFKKNGVFEDGIEMWPEESSEAESIEKIKAFLSSFP